MGIEFVQAGFLMALAGLAIPLLLHFTHRSRPQLADLGSIRFLREILERTRNRRRVMRWLLLSLRVALVGLLALLFARPYLPQRTVGGADQFVAVLVDGSASMRLTHDGLSLFDRACDDAVKLIAETHRGARVETAIFADRVTPVAVDDMQSQQATYGVTDYSAALRWAADLARQSPTADKHVHLFTDQQRSGLEWSEAASLPAGVTLHIHDVMGGDANNVAVTAAAPQRLVVRPGQTAVVDVTISNFGPFTLDESLVALSLRHANKPVRIEQRVTVAAGASEQLQFTAPSLEPGLWQGAVTIEAIDDLMVDNVRHVAVVAAPPLRLLLVDGDARDAAYLSETYFLDLALRLAPSGEVADVSPYVADKAAPEGPLPDLTPYVAVVLANVSGITSADAVRLKDFVSKGGGLLMFGGDRVSAEGSRTLSDAGLVPGTIGANVLSEDLPFRLGSWDDGHSVLVPFADPQHGDLKRLTFRGRTPLSPASDAAVLASFGDGAAALVEQNLGDGRILWFASGCDLQWSDWPRSSMFVPLVHQMVGRLTGLNDGGAVRTSLVNPGAGSATTPGVFEGRGFWQVVNLDPRESETQRCLEGELRMRFADPSSTIAEDAATAAATSQSVARIGAWEFRPNEFWHWIVIALLTLACLEFVVGNRVAA